MSFKIKLKTEAKNVNLKIYMVKVLVGPYKRIIISYYKVPFFLLLVQIYVPFGGCYVSPNDCFLKLQSNNSFFNL